MREVFADAMEETPVFARAHIQSTMDALEQGLPPAILHSDMELFKMLSDLLERYELLDRSSVPQVKGLVQ
jgi:hypothetical protein